MFFNKILNLNKKDYFYFKNNSINKVALSKKEIQDISNEEFIINIKMLQTLYNDLVENLKRLKVEKLSSFEEKNLALLEAEMENLKIDLEETFSIENQKEFNQLFSNFRALFKTYINLITLGSWQSPDFGYSIESQHGLTQKKIYSFQNDYQRYRVNTLNVEKELNSFYKAIGTIKPKTYFFNSGMGAFSTLIKAFENFNLQKVLAGENLYFEVKAILKNYQNVLFLPENNLSLIIDFIVKHEPKYLFFDPVANSPSLPSFDFEKLFEFYKKNPPKEESSIIIDTTLTMDLFEIFAFFKESLPNNFNIFLFRSLQKLDQNGLDLTTGGLITHYGDLKLPLDDLRQMGTMPTEQSILNLESLGFSNNRERFLRHSRNTLLLACYLNNLSNNKNSIIEKVFHPLLREKTLKEFFQIPLFFLSLKEHFNLEDANFFLSKLLENSKKANFNLIAGTSFGFNFSRIMITTFSDSNKICFRLATGIETLEEVYTLIDILELTIENFIMDLAEEYKKDNIILFKYKKDSFEEFLLKLESEKENLEEKIELCIYIIKELNSNIEKFKYYKTTKKYYQESIDYLVESLLKTVSEIKINDEFRKKVVVSLFKLFKE